jgi:CheY-like chemotaxis protein
MRKNYLLMLEQDPIDRETRINNINSVSMGIDVEFLNSSNEVIPFLNQRMGLLSSLPQLIILSMNSLPDNGLVILKQLKSNLIYKHIPVVILGENTLPDLIKECYLNGVNSFINKPFTSDQTIKKIKTFIEYWFDVVELSESNQAIPILTK